VSTTSWPQPVSPRLHERHQSVPPPMYAREWVPADTATGRTWAPVPTTPPAPETAPVNEKGEWLHWTPLHHALAAAIVALLAAADLGALTLRQQWAIEVAVWLALHEPRFFEDHPLSSGRHRAPITATITGEAR